MDILIFKGLFIGFVASISIGPIVFTTIQRTINNGKLSGLIMGLGVAIVDTIFAIIATLSVNSIFNFIESYQVPIRLFGGVIILAVGFKLLAKKSLVQTGEIKNKISTYIADFFSAFLLALSNPLTIVMYALFFVTFNIVPKGINYFELIELYSGIFIGTNLWWGSIVFSTNFIRNQSWLKKSQRLNKSLGSIVIFFGIVSLISLFVV